MMYRPIIAAVIFLLLSAACEPAAAGSGEAKENGSRHAVYVKPNATMLPEKVVKTDAEWKKALTKKQYYILREKGTERAFSGRYWNHKGDGVYVCAACGHPLFASQTKYKSGTGWPSFYSPYSPSSVTTQADHSLFATRTEVLCAKCGGHLGHVFTDGPEPTGLRYCMNSAALQFVQAKKDKESPVQSVSDDVKPGKAEK